MATDKSNAEEAARPDHIDRLDTVNLTAAVELGRRGTYHRYWQFYAA